MSQSGVYATQINHTTNTLYLVGIPNSSGMYTVKLLDGSTIYINADETTMYVKGGPVEFLSNRLIVATIPMSSILYILPPGKE